MPCTEVSPLCPVEASTYGYYPNYGGNVFFTVFFGVCGALQLGYGVYFRTWTFSTALVMGGFLEMAGYIGRVLMNANPWFPPAFKLQIVCLILAPTFVAAGVYLTLKHIILYLGPEHSRLKPRLFTWIFIGCDVGSLILQAVGGGVAAAAGTDEATLQIGDDIIIAGIAFQVATMAVCGILGLEFFVRVWRAGHATGTSLAPSKELSEDAGFKPVSTTAIKITITAEVFAYFTVLVRCIYRCVILPCPVLSVPYILTEQDSRNGRWMGEPSHAQRKRVSRSRRNVRYVTLTLSSILPVTDKKKKKKPG